MRMTKNLLVFALLVSLIVLSACSGSKKTPKTDIFKGTQGIVMNYMADAPRSLIYYAGEDASTVLNILLEVRNKGTFGSSGTIYLTGFDRSIISIASSQQSFSSADLDPVSTYNPEGGYKIFKFEPTSITLPKAMNEYSPIFQATACYQYQTNAVVQVCVDPKPYDTTKKKPCTPTNVGLSGGQGAPIAVTSVEILPTTNKAMFKVTVQNVGGGEVITYNGYANSCTSPGYNDFNQIDVSSINLGTTGCSWKPSNPIMLSNGKAIIYVECPNIQQDTAFSTNLNIVLDYYYRNTIQKKVQIKNIQ